MTYINEGFDFSDMSDVDYTNTFSDIDHRSMYESAVKAIINHMYVIPLDAVFSNMTDSTLNCPAGMMRLRDQAVKDVL